MRLHMPVQIILCITNPLANIANIVCTSVAFKTILIRENLLAFFTNINLRMCFYMCGQTSLIKKYFHTDITDEYFWMIRLYMSRQAF